MKRAQRETRAESKATAQSKREADRVRHEREAFAKKLEAAKSAAETTLATGIVDDE